MGSAMNTFLAGGQQALEDVTNTRKRPAPAALGGPPPQKRPVLPAPTPEQCDALVPAQNQQDPFAEDTDMMTWLSENIETIEKQVSYSTQDGNIQINQTATKKSSPTIPLFTNCKIGSIGAIHFHIHKN